MEVAFYRRGKGFVRIENLLKLLGGNKYDKK